jgi:hypothetical protein
MMATPQLPLSAWNFSSSQNSGHAMMARKP